MSELAESIEQIYNRVFEAEPQRPMESEGSKDEPVEKSQEESADSEPKKEDAKESEQVEDENLSQDKDLEDQAKDGFKIKHDGKEVFISQDKFQQYLQKGYDYEKKMHDIKVQQKLFEQEKAKRDENMQELEQLNEYSKQNPDFLNAVRREWARQQGMAQGNLAPEHQFTAATPDAEIHNLASKVETLEQYINQQRADADAKRRAEVEASQETEIERYKSSYPELKWDEPDELGLTLEDHVMQHALDNGIKSFKVAARDMLWDKHLDIERSRSEGKVTKELQKQQRLGLSKVTNKPQTGRSVNIGKASYDDLASLALQELGIS